MQFCELIPLACERRIMVEMSTGDRAVYLSPADSARCACGTGLKTWCDITRSGRKHNGA